MRFGWIVIALGLVQLSLLAAPAKKPKPTHMPCFYHPPEWKDGHGTDCNLNGIDDPVDIANGTSVDANDNGCPDECED